MDTVFKRASATISFPQPMLVWPSGTVDREAASWVYGGELAALPIVVSELFAEYSEVITTLLGSSWLAPTLAEDSEVTVTLAADSTVDISLDEDSNVKPVLVGDSTL